MEDRQTNFIKGAAILGITGVFVKFLGAGLRIPLTNKLGDGMAYYNVAYTVYSVFLVLATAGIPVAISRLVAERTAAKQYTAARKVFSVAAGMMLIIGGVSFCICFFLAHEIAAMIKLPEAELALKAISPALCLVPVMASFRGYFQGRQNMVPTAVSQLAEQLVRVAVGLSFAFLFFSMGLTAAAAGASFGATAGSAAGLAVILICYLLHRRHGEEQESLASKGGEEKGTGHIVRSILFIAVPIIIGAEIMPIMSAIDTSIIVVRLEASGWTHEAATNLYSQYGAYCNTLISFPQIFTQAVAISLVPAIAATYKQRNSQKVKSYIELGSRITAVMAFPCAVGIFVLAKPIMLLLYPFQAEDAAAAVPTLQIMTAGIVLLAFMQTSTGVLQSIGRQFVPVVNLLAAAVIKLFITYNLVGISTINVRGAAMGTNIAYLLAWLLNMAAVRKYTGVRINLTNTYLKPALMAILMGGFVWIVYHFLSGILGNSLTVIASILLGACFYGGAVLLSKTVSADELRYVSKARKQGK